MKTLSVFIFLMAFSIFCFAQKFVRNENESANEFIERIKPDSNATVSGNVIETFYEKKKLLIAFYSLSDTQTINGKSSAETVVKGYIFLTNDSVNYLRILIDSYGQEGADAFAESVFFANADKDRRRELVIIISWDQSMHMKPISGKLYKVYVYENFDPAKPPRKLSNIKKYDKIFLDEFEGVNFEGEKSHAKFKDAKAVRKKLKALGY